VNNIKVLAIIAGGHAMAAAPLAAQATAVPAPAPQMTEAEAAAVQQSANLGWLIYSYDQAAWHGTDAMLEDVPDPRERGVAGWIVNRLGDCWETVFYRPAKTGGYEAVWAGVYDGRKVIRRAAYAAGERALEPAEVAMVQAIGVLRAQRPGRCAESPFNTVVFPTGKPDGGFYAYLLTPQEKNGEIPFGGHHRFEIVDGEIKDSRSFTRSCLTMPLADEQGKRPEALTISHLLDPMPTELHVFSVYAAGLPVYVMTADNGRVWAVEIADGKPLIRLIR
jgi:hypothetical protein